jgi:hypothetical protein
MKLDAPPSALAKEGARNALALIPSSKVIVAPTVGFFALLVLVIVSAFLLDIRPRPAVGKPSQPAWAAVD